MVLKALLALIWRFELGYILTLYNILMEVVLSFDVDTYITLMRLGRPTPNNAMNDLYRAPASTYMPHNYLAPNNWEM